VLVTFVQSKRDIVSGVGKTFILTEIGLWSRAEEKEKARYARIHKNTRREESQRKEKGVLHGGSGG
jgi:hypothetical protein